MAEPLQIRTVAQLRMVIRSGSGLAITDDANPTRFHPHPDSCSSVTEASFQIKVIDHGGRNGGYFAVVSLAEARAVWPGIGVCQKCAEEEGVVGAEARPAHLAEVLRDASGGARVRTRGESPSGVEAMLENWEATQRVALGERDGGLVLCTWPGELTAQARAFYGSDRAGRVAAMIATPGTPWEATPRPHLAFNAARAGDRFYFSCPMTLAEYLLAWSREEDLRRAGGCSPDSVRDDLWPWLCRRGYADPSNDDSAHGLDRYLEKLARRRSSAHLRPGIELSSRLDDGGTGSEESLNSLVESRILELDVLLR
jgi:hypothetical protein